MTHILPRFRFQHGFSLLELLVVISIIGILLAMGTVAFTTAQRKSRDARRQTDVKVYRDAMEQYYASNSSTYPTGCSGGTFTAFFSGAAPTDPRTGDAYTCHADGDSFCVCALLDEAGKGNASGANAGAATCTYATGGDYYCLSNLQ